MEAISGHTTQQCQSLGHNVQCFPNGFGHGDISLFQEWRAENKTGGSQTRVEDSSLVQGNRMRIKN
jgi:hypothetical protein